MTSVQIKNVPAETHAVLRRRAAAAHQSLQGSVLRRLTLSGRLPARRAALTLDDLVDMPLLRAPHKPLLRRCWDLRETVSSSDAAYVALAEALAVPLVRSDRRLSRAPGVRCHVEDMGSSG